MTVIGPQIRLVHVVFVDPHTTAEWTPIDGLDVAPAVCQAAGFLVRDDETSIAVAAAVHPAVSEVACTFVIPRCCVQSIRDLE